MHPLLAATPLLDIHHPDIEALVAHPLVLSYSRAEPLVDAFLAAYPSYAEGWR